jgi:hypothetical protein
VSQSSSSSSAASTASAKTTSSSTRSTVSSSTASTAGTGGSSQAPPPARSTGGDESIQRFGHEGSASELAAISNLVKRYYAAVATGDDAQACQLLSSRFKSSLLREVGHAGGPIKTDSCVTLLGLLLRKPTGAQAAQEKAVQVTGVRVRGGTAFALIRTPTMPSGEVLLSREGSGWKVSTLIGSELPS